MLEKVKGIFKRNVIQNIPMHVGLTMNGIKKYALDNNEDLENVYKRSFVILNEIINSQIENRLTILSVYVMPLYMKDTTYISQAFIDFLNKLSSSDLIHKNQIKISILGKWYDLPTEVLNPIKNIISETKDYDRFFLNLFINYNGQEEIVDTIKLIVRKVESEKLSVDDINRETVKENLYTSYFIPPDLIIKTGVKKELFGFMMFESVRSKIHFADVVWPKFSVSKFNNIILNWKNI